MVVDGVYTGELDGPFCYGAGKVEAIERDRPLGRASTSPSATPTATRRATCRCCEAVGHPVAVNPDGPLERHARRNGWPIVHFSQRTRAVIRRVAAGLGAATIAAAGFAGGVRYARARS